MYITKRNLEVTVEYGLPTELRIVGLTIDSKTKTIIVKWEKVIVSPTNKVVMTLEEGEFYRYNSETNPKYDLLEQSPIGQGIIAMLQTDLDTYPNFLQNE